MANESNLIPLNKRSKKVQREIQEKGRKANKEKIQARKSLREELLALLEKGDTQEKISLSLIKQAMEGNVKAFETIRDTIGEKPVEKLNTEISGEILTQTSVIDGVARQMQEVNEDDVDVGINS